MKAELHDKLAKDGIEIERPQQPPQEMLQRAVQPLENLSPLGGQMLKGAQQGDMVQQYSPMAANLMEAVKQNQERTPVYQPFAGQMTLAGRQELDAKTREQKIDQQREKEMESLSAQEERDYDTGPAESTGNDFITSPTRITKDFHANEFACKGTGQIKISNELVQRLQQLRDYLGVPINVTSGYRSPEHNASLPGAAPNSRHISGEAADIQASGVSIQQLAAAAKKFFGDGGIGTYGSHVHVDIGPQRRW